MIYEPNTTYWKPGDLVIHDADAKQFKMVMEVIGYNNSTGFCITRYLAKPYSGMEGIFENEIKYLHDPTRFNIQLPVQLVK